MVVRFICFLFYFAMFTFCFEYLPSHLCFDKVKRRRFQEFPRLHHKSRLDWAFEEIENGEETVTDIHVNVLIETCREDLRKIREK